MDKPATDYLRISRKHIITILAALAWYAHPAGAGGPPYPPSPVIAAVAFDWETRERRAVGSDNWPLTWANNDHQYTSWGDGGGFGGSGKKGRVSLGVGRIEGTSSSFRGVNVWGGWKPENEATFRGKSYGILCVDSVIYMWVSPKSGASGYAQTVLHRSVDHGASWSTAPWKFTRADGLINPAFLQFGRDYDGARDEYVYIYANHFKNDSAGLQVQKPGEIALLRVPKESVFERSEYEFFAGLTTDGMPTWEKDVKKRQPVFRDAAGVGWATGGVSYNAGLGRYLLITEHDETARGNLAIFDAPEPWGPWSTVSYLYAFGKPFIAPTIFYGNFSSKWLGSGGKTFTLVFTGVGENDAWNSIRGNFLLRKRQN